MAPTTIKSSSRNAYSGATLNIGWSAHSIFSYRTAIQQLAGSITSNIGAATNQHYVAMSVTPGSAISVSEVRIPIGKFGSPTDTLSLEIQSDASSKPSGTVIASAANSYNGANIMSASTAWLSFIFATPMSWSASTKYWLVIKRSGAADASNYYTTLSESSVYAGGGRAIYDSGTSTWASEIASVDLAFQIIQPTPIALYTVTQDTALHVFKSTDNGATWTEQDSTNAPTVSTATFPFDARDTNSGPYIMTSYLTATNTGAAKYFNMSTDTWQSGTYGTTSFPVNLSNERNIRATVDNTFITSAPGTLYLHYTDSLDDADLAFSRVTAGTTSWTIKISVLAANSTEASLISEAVIDKASPGYTQALYYDCANDDFSNRSVWGSGVQGTETDLNATAATVETSHTAATYQPYDNGSYVDTVIAAYINSSNQIVERILTLEATSASVTMATENVVSTSTTAAGRQITTARYNGTNYVVWASSGTGISYATSTVAGTWSGATTFLSGGTNIFLSEIKDIGGGLAIVYTNNGNAVFDWIVAPAAGGTRTATPVTMALQATKTRTATPTISVQKINTTRTATPVTMSLAYTITRTSTPVTAALQATKTRTATPTIPLIGTLTRTASSVTAALQATKTRTATPTISVALQVTRTATPVTVALQATSTRTASPTVALSQQRTRTATPTIPVQSTSTRTATGVTISLAEQRTRTASPVTMALQDTETRTSTPTIPLSVIATRSATPVTVALMATKTRTATGVTISAGVTPTRTATPVTLALQATLTRTASATIAVQKINTTRTATPITAALLATLTRSATPTIPLIGTLTRTAPATISLSGSGNIRTASPVTIALMATLTRTANPVTVAVSVINNTRTATPITAALMVTATRTATPTIPLIQTRTRTASSVTMALSGTFTRTAAPTIAISKINNTRTASPVTAALLATGTRTASATIATQATATRVATGVTLALLAEKTRTATATIAVSEARTRVAATTIALLQTTTRTASLVTMALSETHVGEILLPVTPTPIILQGGIVAIIIPQDDAPAMVMIAQDDAPAMSLSANQSGTISAIAAQDDAPAMAMVEQDTAPTAILIQEQ